MTRIRAVVVVVFLAVVAAVLSGCSTIPQTQLTQYRDAFGQTRTSCEHILLDFAADKANRDALHAAAAAGAPAAAPTGWPSQFDPKAVHDDNVAEDSIALRLRVWGVVAAYNDALVAVAENRPSSEIGASVGGLMDVLKSFPVHEIASSASAATPFGPAIQLALTEMEKEYRAAQFRKAVLAGAPLIHQFISLLHEDLAPLYKDKEVLAQDRYDDVKEKVRSEFERFKSLVATAQDGATPDDQADRAQLIGRVNTAVQGVRRKGGWTPIDPKVAGKGDAFASARPQIMSSMTTVETNVADALAIDHEMATYFKLFEDYELLIQRTDEALAGLEGVAANPQRSLPPMDDLVQMTIVVRRSIAEFDKAR